MNANHSCTIKSGFTLQPLDFGLLALKRRHVGLEVTT